jgi:hypothetical protein
MKPRSAGHLHVRFHVRKTIRLFLAIAAVAAGLLSLLSLYFWSIRTIGVLSGHGVIDTGRQFMPNMMAQASDLQVLLVQAREYFAVFGGIVGWASLAALCVFANRSFGALPKWVIIGCLIGAGAALAVPGGGVYAFPPITMAVILLLRCYIPKPNYASQPTASGGG